MISPFLPIQPVAGRTTATSTLHGTLAIRLPRDSVVRRTLMTMAGGGNRYPEGPPGFLKLPLHGTL